MKCAIYARKSSEEHQQASIEVQLGEARRWIEAKGWTLDPAHEYVDSGVSRAEFKKRPALIKLLSDASKKAFDVVVVRDESRIGGDTNRTSLVIQELLDSGTRLWYYFSNEEIRLKGAVDKMLISVRAFAAELEREKISERTREHLVTKARAGFICGGRVYGYSNYEIKESDRRIRVEYRINEGEAKIVREIFERYSNGEGLKAIAKSLNARGIESPRGRGWLASAIRPMLVRTIYIGKREWGQTSRKYEGGTKKRYARPQNEWINVELPHLRIIDDELWTAVQKQRGAKERFGAPTRRGSKAKYLLTGIARCSMCGGRIGVTNGKASYESIQVYTCWNRRNKGTCENSLRRPVKSIDAAIVQHISEKILNEEVITKVLAEVRRRLSSRTETQADDLRDLETQAIRVKKELDNLVNALAKFDDKPDSVMQGITERQQRLSALSAQISAMKQAPQAIDFELRKLEEQARSKLQDLRGLFERNPEQGRKVIEGLLDGPLVFQAVQSEHGPRFKITGRVSGSIVGVPNDVHAMIPREILPEICLMAA